jgi:uncharacterized protein YdcH (DUF465 family)
MKNKTEIRDLQEQHKKLDRLTTDLEKGRSNDRTTSGKYDLVELKKEKLAIKDKINKLRQQKELE